MIVNYLIRRFITRKIINRINYMLQNDAANLLDDDGNVNMILPMKKYLWEDFEAVIKPLDFECTEEKFSDMVKCVIERSLDGKFNTDGKFWAQTDITGKYTDIKEIVKVSFKLNKLISSHEEILRDPDLLLRDI